MADDVDLKEVAARCLGMSGADLANFMNEAAINCARNNKPKLIGPINKDEVIE